MPASGPAPLHGRHRDKNGEVSKKHGNTLVGTLRRPTASTSRRAATTGRSWQTCCTSWTNRPWRSWSVTPRAPEPQEAGRAAMPEVGIPQETGLAVSGLLEAAEESGASCVLAHGAGLRSASCLAKAPQDLSETRASPSAGRRTVVLLFAPRPPERLRDRPGPVPDRSGAQSPARLQTCSRGYLEVP